MMISPRHALLLIAGALAVSASAHAAGTGGLWDDIPLKIIQTTSANFPPQLAAEGIMAGEVRAVISVDADGKFTDCLVTAYTHPAFAREVLASLRAWEYRPARQRGELVGTRADVAFVFEARGMVVSVTSAHEVVSARMNRLFGNALISFVCKVRELDQPLTVVEVVQPRHPGKLLQPSHPNGTVLLDFYIDAEGRPRMPVVLRASHDAFAMAAIAALSQWRFNPPTRTGRPTAVRVRQEFIFRDES